MYRPFFGHLCKSFSVILPAASVSSHINSHLCRLTSRFGKANENDINDILQSKDSKNTKNATKVALQTLTAYIIEADKDVNLCDCSPKQLAELLVCTGKT
jgi:hypothetical protein